MAYSNFELLQIQTEALYVYDSANRILHVNEPDADGTSVRFFLARSASGNIWRVRHDLPADLIAELERLAASEPVVSELDEPPYHQLAYMELLAAHAPIGEIYSGPAYYLPQSDTPGHAVLITDANKSLLQNNFPYTLDYLQALSPIAAVVEDGKAVAACSSVRLTPRAAEAGLYTQEAYRGCGYGVEAARLWAQSVYAAGRIPLYSTTWENTASQAVARKLGAVQYGADFSIA